MSCFGSTIGITNYPNMLINYKFQNFPRPYSTYNPNTEGYLFIKKNAFSIHLAYQSYSDPIFYATYQ